jgi:long-chain acyl-CoA synthetase
MLWLCTYLKIISIFKNWQPENSFKKGSPARIVFSINQLFMTPARTFDLLDRYENHPEKENAFCIKQNGQWKKYSSKDYVELSHLFCYGLMTMGLGKGDKIMTVTNNRPEWNFADMGMAMAGIIHVPVFTSLRPDEYRNIIIHSEARIVIAGDIRILNNVKSALGSFKNQVELLSFDTITGTRNWQEITEAGRQNREQLREKAEQIKGAILPDDPATLIYTSGTTGSPKGVLLTHRNLVSNFLSAAKIFKLQPQDKFLSILPLCHVGGRLGNYQTQYSMAGIYYAEHMGTIAANMAEIKPEGFDAVPRIIEKFYSVIISKGNKLTGIKKKIFFQAVKIGLKYKPFGENGWFYEQKLKLADRLVFSKWRQALGGNVKIAGCGGASLPPRLERIFWAAGIKIINMYGLTETSPIITINGTEEGQVKLGSVGTTIEGVEVKIADDGEILCKGPNVTPGYFKDPELTKVAFTKDGWFCTGDIGHLEEGKFLMVTDRKKEIFKLSNGKFIAPQLIENIFRESPFIDQIMVIGEHQKFPSALIAPDFRYLEDWKKTEHITVSSNEELMGLPAIQAIFSSEVEKLNKKLNPTERLHRIRLVADEWAPASGELSPTLKLRRQFILEKYKELINQIFMIT